MSNWLSDILLRNKPGSVPVAIRRFTTADVPLGRDNIAVEGNGWLVDAQEDQVVRLFEVTGPDIEVDRCMLIYRAALKSEGLEGRAYLEMWCRFSGRGEFFSRGLNQTIKRTTDWSSYETPFRLKKGQQPDLVKLNLVIEGRGKVWIRGIELLRAAR